jgi:hypothetical protein
VTVTVCPAIATDPLRPGPLVPATTIVTDPLPTPLGVETEIQSSLLDAVHGQPALVVTATG